MKSKLYKLILKNRIIAEGSKAEMRKRQKQTPESFVGMGSPHSQLGEVWNKAFPSF